MCDSQSFTLGFPLMTSGNRPKYSQNNSTYYIRTGQKYLGQKLGKEYNSGVLII